MNLQRRFLYTLAFVLTLPTAQGAGIDLHQRGLTGSWYDPRTSGQGFLVQVYPDMLSPGTGIVQASWATYDDVVGGAERQRWYTLNGPVVSGQTHVSMTIYQNTGGNFNGPPITTAHPVGTATLSFDSCTSGQLAYNFTDGSDGFGHLDAGLFFIAFLRSPATNFIPVLAQMSGDALNEYIFHTGTAVFACPPGLREGDSSAYWGSTLFG